MYYTGVGAEPWLLPEHFRDTTGVVFATSFPALDTAIAEVSKFYETKALYNQHIPIIIDILRSKLTSKSPNGILSKDVEDAIDALVSTLQSSSPDVGYNEPNTVKPYEFDRKFLFRVLVLGNAQLAQIIKARGPNMQTNAACAGMYIIPFLLYYRLFLYAVYAHLLLAQPCNILYIYSCLLTKPTTLLLMHLYIHRCHSGDRPSL